MAKILLTGGGTAGHVTPNLALLPELYERGYEVYYIGSKNGMEADLVKGGGVKYFPISSGKLRRYFDFQNITDVARIVKGFSEAIRLLKKMKPDVVFSKGGFVTSPVVWAAWILKIPVILHESDYTPGLANKLSLPFCKLVCLSFPETAKYISSKHTVVTGIPIRKELFSGNADTGRKICGFTKNRPVIMVIGGSQGSRILNDMIRKGLHQILNSYQICHICGKGGVDESYLKLSGYRQFEYVIEEQPHLFAMSDIVVSRAGATTLFEILALRKLNILVPLSKKASRGDQIFNASSFEKQGFSKVIQEGQLTHESLLEMCSDILKNKDYIYKKMLNNQFADSTLKIVEIISQFIDK